MTTSPQPDVSAIVREYAPFVLRVLRHLGLPDSQLDDASQEVLLAVFRKLPEFAQRSALRTWIYGICVNVARAARRKTASRGECLMDDVPETPVEAAQDTALLLKRHERRLLEVLATLDEDQRSVFVLYEIEELSMEEIASALAAPITSCYSRLYAAREKVRSQFRREAVFPRRRIGAGS